MRNCSWSSAIASRVPGCAPSAATLDAIDEAGREAGEPELAALVVRESDRLPGQGWWVGKVYRLGYEGPWTGKEALAFVRTRQELAFDYWKV